MYGSAGKEVLKGKSVWDVQQGGEGMKPKCLPFRTELLQAYFLPICVE